MSLYTSGMAGKPIPALDYLAQPEKHPPQPVCAVFGDESFLRRQAILCLRAAVLGGDDGDFSLSSFEGRGTLFRDVYEVLSTVAMFGGGRRLAVVEDADDFVTRYRPQLEDYVARPSRSGVLVLDLDSLPSNTRLYKSIAAEGLLIDCGGPGPGQTVQVAGRVGQAAPPRPAFPGGGRNAGRADRAGTGAARSGVGQAGADGRRREEDHARVGRPLGGRLAGQNHLGNARRRPGRQRPRGHAATRSPAGRAASSRSGCWGRFRPRCAALPPPRGWCFRPKRPAAASISARPWSRRASARSCCKRPNGNSGCWAASAAPTLPLAAPGRSGPKGESAMPPRLILERLIVRLSARPKVGQVARISLTIATKTPECLSAEFGSAVATVCRRATF